MNDFVDRIDELLSHQKKNRNALYEDLNLSKNLIAQWKQRGTIPSADTALKIAQYLHTSVEYLLTGTESDEYEVKYENLKNDLQSFIKSH